MSLDLTSVAGVVPVLARLGRILDQASTTLPLHQYRLLTMIARGESQASRLASRLPVAKPTVTSSIEVMVGRGFICRERDADDGRVTRLEITDAGRLALTGAERILTDRIAPYLSGVSRPELLIELLVELDDQIELQHGLKAGR